MKVMQIDRRHFLGGLAAAACIPASIHASRKSPRRQLLDVTNRFPLPDTRIRFRNETNGKFIRVRTDKDGYWDISVLADQVRATNGVWFRADIDAREMGEITYAGIRHWFRLLPGGAELPANRREGHLALLPLAHPGISLGVEDDDLSVAWPTLLREALFAREPYYGTVPSHLSRGAITPFVHRKPVILLGESLTPAEQAFIGDIISETLPLLSADFVKPGTMLELPAAEEPFFAAGSGEALTVVKRSHFTKPVCIAGFSPDVEYAIDAATIFLDQFTLDGLFREGAGSPDEIDLARHIVARALAEALGYRPTLALPGRTVLDANVGPGVTAQRPGVRPEDLLLARVLYDSGWIRPGARLTEAGDRLENLRPF